jgi:hypothetical protein
MNPRAMNPRAMNPRAMNPRAMNHCVFDRISRLYDGPLVSSLTAFAIIALSIVVSVSL